MREGLEAGSAALWRAAVDVLMDPVVLLRPLRDGTGRLVDLEYLAVNAPAAAYAGRTVEAMTRARVCDLWPRESVGHLLDWVGRVLDTGAPLALDDTQITSAVRPGLSRYDVRAVPFEDCVLLTWREVTERSRAAERLRASEARYRLLAENSGDVVLAVALDGTITWASPSSTRTLGWSPESLVGRRNLDLVHPDDVAWFTAEARRLAAAGGSGSLTVRFLREDGTHRWMNTASEQAVGEDGAPVRVVRLRDVEDEVRAVEALRAGEQRFRMLAESSSDVILQIDPADGRVGWASPSCRALLGWEPDELVGRAAGELVHPDDRDRWATELTGRDRAVLVHRVVRRDGEPVWVETASTLVAATATAPALQVARLRDVEQHVHAQRELEELARTDALTGLLSRREGLRRLAACLGPERAGREVVALFCDLDGFKAVNDTRGHQVGDALLAAVAERLLSVVRGDDFAVRLGGDEMLVVLDGVADLPTALDVAERVRAAIALPLAVDGEPVRVTVSIGVVPARSGETAGALVHRADQAMYRAKETGRDQVVAVG